MPLQTSILEIPALISVGLTGEVDSGVDSIGAELFVLVEPQPVNPTTKAREITADNARIFLIVIGIPRCFSWMNFMVDCVVCQAFEHQDNCLAKESQSGLIWKQNGDHF
jgi:hypothetical protein